MLAGGDGRSSAASHAYARRKPTAFPWSSSLLVASVCLAACDGGARTAPVPTVATAVPGPITGAVHGPAPDGDGIVRVARGERVGFSMLARDGDGDLLGAEWYLDGEFVGAQYRNSLPGATGERSVFWRGIEFPSAGVRHRVSALAFDKQGNYAEAAEWQLEVEPRPRLMYVDRTDERLRDNAGIAAIARFAHDHGFNQVALYSLRKVLSDPALSDELPELLRAFRDAGVTRAFAVVASVESLDRVRGYQESHPEAAERFDGLLTELEFWRDEAVWPDYMALLAHMRWLADRDDLVVATYVGWLEERHIGAIVGLVDLVLVHAYVPAPARAFGYLAERLEQLSLDWAQPVAVWPILSAQRHERDAGGGPRFMGDWLRKHRGADPLERAEQTVLRAFHAAAGSYRNGVRLGGFAWFAARHLEAALDDAR